MDLYIVTGVDVGESCDGKSRLLKICKTYPEAEEYVRIDMKTYFDRNLEHDDFILDKDKMSVHTEDYNKGCEWNIEKIEVPKPSDEQLKSTCKVLIDNGIEEDEAETVLQAIGYTLLDMELYPDCVKQ